MTADRAPIVIRSATLDDAAGVAELLTHLGYPNTRADAHTFYERRGCVREGQRFTERCRR